MTPWPLQTPSPPSPFYSYVKTLFLSPPSLASPRAGPPGVGGFPRAAPSAADPKEKKKRRVRVGILLNCKSKLLNFERVASKFTTNGFCSGP